MTAIAGPTRTFTPFPTLTPNLTATAIGAPTVDAFHSDAPPVAEEPGQDAGGTFYDPNAPASTQSSLPVAPAGAEIGPGGTDVLPEAAQVVINYGGQVVPILDLSNLPGSGSAAAGTGVQTVFAVGADGQVAQYNGEQLVVNGAPFQADPATLYGLDPNLHVIDLVWSPDGARLAITLTISSWDHDKAISAGVWVYEVGTGEAHHVLRDQSGGTYQGDQAGEQGRPIGVQWAADSGSLIVTVQTPLGQGSVPLSAFKDVDDPAPVLPYAWATWPPGRTDFVVVSGSSWDQNGARFVGRVPVGGGASRADAVWQGGELNPQAAVMLPDGRVAFLGGPLDSAFALYAFDPSAADRTPVQLSGWLSGQIMTVEWNAERDAALVTAQVAGQQRLYVVRVDGASQDATPGEGLSGAAHWGGE